MPAPRFSLIFLVILVIAAGAVIAAAFAYDAPVREMILEAQGKGWKRTPEAAFIGKVSKYGDWPQLMIAGGVGLLVAWRLRRSDWTRIIAAAMIASTLTGVVANASRLTTGRTRPRESPKIEQGWYGPYHDGKLLIGNSKYNAFPSGHTATAVGFAAVFVYARPLLGVFILAGGIAIAWSRMALGAHHLSDVVVSILLAFAIAWFVWRWVEKHGTTAAQWIGQRIARLRSRPA